MIRIILLTGLNTGTLSKYLARILWVYFFLLITNNANDCLFLTALVS